MQLLLFNLIRFICLLLAVAFYTLFERKILGYIQFRLGPNKVRFAGVLQPIADAVKLICKSWFIPLQGNKSFFIFIPICSLILAGLLFLLIENSYFYREQIGALFFLIFLALGVFPICLAGWRSNRIYRKLGGYRSLAQSISYEVAIFFLILFPILLIKSIRLFSSISTISLFNFIILIIMVVVVLAETNRAPFDLSEGESELVSGFNTEYSGSGFTILFLAEYAQMLVISLIVASLYISSRLSMIIRIIVFSLLLIIRRAYPRLRYDVLIRFIWVSSLPLINAFLLVVPFI